MRLGSTFYKQLQVLGAENVNVEQLIIGPISARDCRRVLASAHLSRACLKLLLCIVEI